MIETTSFSMTHTKGLSDYHYTQFVARFKAKIKEYIDAGWQLVRSECSSNGIDTYVWYFQREVKKKMIQWYMQ